jgi:hypothetical protein
MFMLYSFRLGDDCECLSGKEMRGTVRKVCGLLSQLNDNEVCRCGSDQYYRNVCMRNWEKQWNTLVIKADIVYFSNNRSTLQKNKENINFT